MPKDRATKVTNNGFAIAPYAKGRLKMIRKASKRKEMKYSENSGNTTGKRRIQKANERGLRIETETPTEKVTEERNF